jgi:hypothetical protein
LPQEANVMAHKIAARIRIRIPDPPCMPGRLPKTERPTRNAFSCWKYVY